jgi:thiamine-phosphate pyrophosphorylase
MDLGPALPRLYAVTDDRRAESHVEQARRFAAGGARLVQIRAKRASGRELFEIVAAALEAVRGAGALLIVNDRVDVALAAGAHGVHVGQDDLPPGDARAILGPERIVGLSTHTPEQAREAARLPVDYVAYGPVFVTGTKENPDPAVGLAGLAAARAIVGRPLVAIGGITLDTAPSVLEAGADSVAVIADLWAEGEAPEARVARYLAALPAAG